MVDKVGGTPGQMTNHLKRRGARYYFRRKIPASLHAHYGKKEIVLALGTSDYQEAKRLAAVHTVRTDSEWAKLSAPSSADAGLADAYRLAGEWEQEYRANREHHEAMIKGERAARASVVRPRRSACRTPSTICGELWRSCLTATRTARDFGCRCSAYILARGWPNCAS
jgi:hypothetical protein